MLHQFLLYNKVNQQYVYIYPHIPSLLSLSPTLPIPSLQVVTKHPVLCGCFPLAIHFTFGSAYMSMPLSHFIPASPPTRPPPRALKPFSTSALVIPYSKCFKCLLCAWGILSRPPSNNSVNSFARSLFLSTKYF